MAWSGYVGLGTITSGVFAELTNSEYARLPFTFGSPAAGRVAGSGPTLFFPAVTSGTAWTHDALAFFAASTGGTPVLIYPHAVAGMTVSPGAALRIMPAHTTIDLLTGLTGSGATIPASQIAIVAGTGNAAGAGRSTLGNRWAVMGDSISANGGIVPTGFRTQASNGYVNWLAALSRQNINIEPDANFSLSGRTTAQIATTLPAVLAYAPDWCVVEGGTNDPGNSLTPAQSIANLGLIFSTLLAAGINIVAIPVTPRTAPNGYTTAQMQQLAYINIFIRRFARNQNHSRMVVADPRWSGFTNTTTGLPATGYTSDGLHPNATGAKAFGQTILTAVTPFIQTNDTVSVFYDLFDTYDSVQNITGNMLANSMFTTATGGSFSTTPAGVMTGASPASWSAIFTGAGSAYTGTLVMSNVARADGLPGNLMRITAASLSGTGGGAQDKVQLFQQVNFPSGLAVGDVCEAMVEIFVNATAGFNGFDVNIGMSDGNGVTSFQTQFGPMTNSTAWPQGTYRVVLKTPRMTVGPANGGSTRTIQGFVNTYFDTSATGPATAVIDIASLSLRKVIFP